MNDDQTRYWLSIMSANVGRKVGVPADLLVAMCLTESGGDPLAVRYESHYRWLVDLAGEPLGDGDLSDTERSGQMTSWGLMQIMGANARTLGFRGKWFTELCAMPAVGLEYGARWLKRLLDKYGNEADAVAAYNWGSPEKDEQGRYKNPWYVNRVQRHLGRELS